MPTANRYGIDLSNILSSASAIKSARLNRRITERNLEKDKAKERNVMRTLKKRHSPDAESDNVLLKSPQVEQMDISADEDIVPIEQEQPVQEVPVVAEVAETAYGFDLTPEEMQDYALDPKAYSNRIAEMESKIALQRRYESNKTTLQLTMPNATPDQIDTLAKMKTENVAKMYDMYSNADKRQKEALKNVINVNARKLFTITQETNPILRAKQWKLFRDDRINSAPDKESRDKLSNDLPENYDANWVGLKMAESKDVFDTMNKISMKETEFGRKKSIERIKTGAKGAGSKQAIQLQKDITSIGKQISSIKSGANIMNEDNKLDAINEANKQYTQKLKALKRTSTGLYESEFGKIGGENDPLTKINTRTKAINGKGFSFPDGYNNLSDKQKEAWKSHYVTSGEELPLSIEEKIIGSDVVTIDKPVENKYKNAFR